MKNGNKVAFPAETPSCMRRADYQGLTKLEYIATKMLASLVSSSTLPNEEIAKDAVVLANALIKALNTETLNKD